MIDYNIESELQQHLDINEKLQWTDRPKTGIVFRSSDIFLIPFSFIWFGFAIFWNVGVSDAGAPIFFRLWGLPFLVIGFYFAIGRFWYDARKRQSTIYGITDSRIIIKSGIFSQEVKSLNIKTLSDISMSQKNDGSGTISLGPTDYRYAMMQGMDWPGVKQPPRLELINNVSEVYSLLVKLQRS